MEKMLIIFYGATPCEITAAIFIHWMGSACNRRIYMQIIDIKHVFIINLCKILIFINGKAYPLSRTISLH